MLGAAAFDSYQRVSYCKTINRNNQKTCMNLTKCIYRYDKDMFVLSFCQRSNGHFPIFKDAMPLPFHKKSWTSSGRAPGAASEASSIFSAF